MNHRTHRRVPGSLVLFALVALFAAAPAARAAFVFWSDSSGVHRANAADGSDVRDFPFFAQNLVVSDGKLFSIFENQVRISNFDGTNLQPAPGAPAAVQDVLRNVARDPLGNVYTSSEDQAHVVRTDAGGESETIAATGHTFSPSMTLRFDPIQNKVYWMGGWNDLNSGLLQRANPDGSNVETLIGPALLRLEDYTMYFSLDVAGGWVYWGDQGSSVIRRAPLRAVTDGDDIQDLVQLGQGIQAIAAEPTPEPGVVLLIVPALAMMRVRTRRASSPAKRGTSVTLPVTLRSR